MVQLTKFGEEFLKLALRISKHIKGYVDFYIGPQRIRKIVDNESKTSPNKLLKDCKSLLNQLWKQGYDKKREIYLKKLLIAMETSIERIIGTEIPFKELFLRFYDIELKPTSETELYNLKEEFNNAYRGSGTLKEIMEDLRTRRKVPAYKVYDFFKKALSIVKSKTIELFKNLLPQEENIVIELDESKNNDKVKWSYYNWYLGNFCSRIQINPNYNIFWTNLLSSAAHEGYPGHHMEFVIKEHSLCNDLMQFEHLILLLNSPKLIISEGIARLAINVLFSYENNAEISIEEFCLEKEKEDPIEIIAKQLSIKKKIDFIWQNIGYYALIEEWSKTKLFRYADRYEFFSSENIKNQIALLSNPVYSTTTFSYNLGSNLIMNKFGEFPAIINFKYLLKNPVLPSDLIK
jgi:hypothetical protein